MVLVLFPRSDASAHVTSDWIAYCGSCFVLEPEKGVLEPEKVVLEPEKVVLEPVFVVLQQRGRLCNRKKLFWNKET